MHSEFSMSCLRGVTAPDPGNTSFRITILQSSKGQVNRLSRTLLDHTHNKQAMMIRPLLEHRNLGVLAVTTWARQPDLHWIGIWCGNEHPALDALGYYCYRGATSSWRTITTTPDSWGWWLPDGPTITKDTFGQVSMVNNTWVDLDQALKHWIPHFKDGVFLDTIFFYNFLESLQGGCNFF